MPFKSWEQFVYLKKNKPEIWREYMNKDTKKHIKKLKEKFESNMNRHVSSPKEPYYGKDAILWKNGDYLYHVKEVSEDNYVLQPYVLSYDGSPLEAGGLTKWQSSLAEETLESVGYFMPGSNMYLFDADSDKFEYLKASKEKMMKAMRASNLLQMEFTPLFMANFNKVVSSDMYLPMIYGLVMLQKGKYDHSLSSLKKDGIEFKDNDLDVLKDNGYIAVFKGSVKDGFVSSEEENSYNRFSKSFRFVRPTPKLERFYKTLNYSSGKKPIISGDPFSYTYYTDEADVRGIDAYPKRKFEKFNNFPVVGSDVYHETLGHGRVVATLGIRDYFRDRDEWMWRYTEIIGKWAHPENLKSWWRFNRNVQCRVYFDNIGRDVMFQLVEGEWITLSEMIGTNVTFVSSDVGSLIGPLDYVDIKEMQRIRDSKDDKKIDRHIDRKVTSKYGKNGFSFISSLSSESLSKQVTELINWSIYIKNEGLYT